MASRALSLKIPSEMELAMHYTLLYTVYTVYTVLLIILFKLLYTAFKHVACMPIYIVREGYNAIGMGRSASDQNVR